MLLGNRYLNDDISEWELNPIQLKYREQFLRRLHSGEYKSEQIKTCLCGGKTFEIISEKDRYGLPFGNVICKKCGLLLCAPRLVSESLPKFYDSDYHGLVLGSENVNDFEHMVRKDQGSLIYKYLDKYLTQDREYTVLELGAGVGNNLRGIRDDAKKRNISVNIYGCEYSKACVDFGRDKYQVDLIHGGTADVAKLGRKYDIVIMSHILEHFTNPLHELNIIKKIIHDDSLLYIEVPGIFDLHNKGEYRCDFLRYLVLAHMYNFSLGTLSNVLSLAGFTLVEGTEFVRSVFKSTPRRRPQILNYYNKTIEYLRNQEQNRRLFFEFNQAKTEIGKLKGFVDQLRQRANDADEKDSGVEITRNALSQYLEVQKNVDKEINNLKNSIIGVKDFENQINVLRVDLTSQISNQRLENEKIVAQITAQRDKLEISLRSEVAELQKKCRILQEEREKIEQSLNAEIDELRRSSRALEAEKVKMQADYDHRVITMRDDAARIESWFKGEIVQILNEKRTSEFGLKKELDASQSEKSALVRRHTSELESLRLKLRNLEEQYTDLQSSYTDLNRWHRVMLNSLSWRLTAPIRTLKEMIFPSWKAK